MKTEETDKVTHLSKVIVVVQLIREKRSCAGDLDHAVDTSIRCKKENEGGSSSRTSIGMVPRTHKKHMLRTKTPKAQPTPKL